jgi:adenylate cyclase
VDQKQEAKLIDQVVRRLALAGLVANGAGGLILFLLLGFLFPSTLDSSEANSLQLRNGLVLLVLLPLTLLFGRTWTLRAFQSTVGWLQEGEQADEQQRRALLAYPLLFTRAAATFWLVGVVVFTPLNLSAGIEIALIVAVAICLGGLTACALQYLLVERAIRPITAVALGGGAPPEVRTPGVAARLTMAWLLATGVPLLGLAAVAVWYLTGANIEASEVVSSTLFLAVLALVVGLLAVRMATRSVAEPLASMRGALREVQRGRFDSRVPVDDGSEVGLLQAGFNQMATGLGERELLREAFGAYVDPDVAERVIQEGTDLAGEDVEVSILFIDVRGFTTYSERAEAREVVAELNRLYEQVVPLIVRHGGHANKFIGDGLLAVFGAPERLDDHAERAVRAAREIAGLAKGRGSRFRVGAGVNSGTVVAGTIGGGGRLDFTVIGDTVNTAARVEAATRQTGDDLLITEATLGALGNPDGEWIERKDVTLKGKARSVRLYAPAR